MCHVLLTYLRAERGRATRIARAIPVGVQFVWQIARGERGCPAAMAAKLERACDGEVTRRDLFPDDWQEIWPELAVVEGADA